MSTAYQRQPMCKYLVPCDMPLMVGLPIVVSTSAPTVLFVVRKPLVVLGTTLEVNAPVASFVYSPTQTTSDLSADIGVASITVAAVQPTAATTVNTQAVTVTFHVTMALGGVVGVHATTPANLIFKAKIASSGQAQVKSTGVARIIFRGRLPLGSTALCPISPCIIPVFIWHPRKKPVIVPEVPICPINPRVIPTVLKRPDVPRLNRRVGRTIAPQIIFSPKTPVGFIPGHSTTKPCVVFRVTTPVLHHVACYQAWVLPPRPVTWELPV